MFKPSILKLLLVMAPALQASVDCGDAPHHFRAGVRHIEGGGIGYKRGYTTLEAFASTDPGRWSFMPFLDLRGHVFNDGKLAANAGIGARSIFGCRAYGANLYYDYRHTDRNDYNQIGVGLETLGSLWDLRVNGYIPVGKRISRPYDIRFGGFQGHSVLVNRKFQYDMGGVDGEVGFHFARSCDIDFYGAIGPYYFRGEFGKSATGGKARIGVNFHEYVTLELSDSYDNVFKNKFQGQLTLTIPFGPRSTLKEAKGCCSIPLARRMVQPVSRQEIIVVDSRFKKQAANNYFIFVNNLSHSAGTFESPYPTLLEAQDNSKPGDYIYVFPGDGTPTGLNQGFVFQNNQQLLGSSTSHTIATNLGTITIPALTSLTPTIGNTADPVILLANNNVISGFNIDMLTGTNGSAIRNTAPITNLVISNNTLISYSNTTIDLNNVSGNLYIVNNKATTQNFFSPVISIVNNNIQNANYFITNNNLNTGLELLQLNFTDCSGITTTLSNNLLNNDDYGATIIVTNAASQPANIFNFQNNTIYTQDVATINVVLSGFANAAISFDNNSLDNNYADGIDISLANNAVCNLNLSNNRMRALDSAISVAATDDSAFNLVATNNFLGGGDANAIGVVTRLNAIANASIMGNTLTSIDGNVVDFTSRGNSAITLNLENNTLYATPYVSTVNCAAISTGTFTANVSGNYLSFGNLTFASNADNFISAVDNNQFMSAKAFISNNSTGTLCQQFNGNVSNIVQYTDGTTPYNISNTSGGTLNLETPVGNVGQFTLTGVTPVPPNTCTP